jgi:hypothetical protein
VSVGDSLSGDRGGGSVDESLLLASTRRAVGNECGCLQDMDISIW